MEFRLTYQGPLNSTQRDPLDKQRDKNADHKHDLRKPFHKQLKRLWETRRICATKKALHTCIPKSPELAKGERRTT
jgi:hypothetical protein